MIYRRLSQVANVRLSNVDKKAAEDEQPIRLCNYVDVYNHDEIVVNLPLMDATASKEQIARFALRQGDVLITKDSETADDIAVPAYVAADMPDVVCGYHLAIVRPNHGLDGRYLFWALTSSRARTEFSVLANGVTRYGLRQDAFGQVRIPVPVIATQRAIADYLDAETVRIDALIEKKRRMVELLEERLAAFCSRTVLGACGLGSSQQGWSPTYGRIPVSWGETSLRHLHCDVQTGPFGSQLHADEYVVNGWPVVNPTNLSDGRIVATPTTTITDAKREVLARHILRLGDIVFGRRGEMGKAAVVESYQEGWVCGTGSLRLRILDPRLTPTYLKLLLETPPARAYFELSAVGSTIDNLNTEILLRFPTLLPPRRQQEQIVSAVGTATVRVELLHSRLRDQLALLTERRQALITAAVTGELSIPGVAA